MRRGVIAFARLVVVSIAGVRTCNSVARARSRDEVAAQKKEGDKLVQLVEAYKGANGRLPGTLDTLQLPADLTSQWKYDGDGEQFAIWTHTTRSRSLK